MDKQVFDQNKSKKAAHLSNQLTEIALLKQNPFGTARTDPNSYMMSPYQTSMAQSHNIKNTISGHPIEYHTSYTDMLVIFIVKI